MKNRFGITLPVKSLFLFSPRYFLLAILATVVLSGCGGKDDRDNSNPLSENNDGVTTLSATLNLPSYENPSHYAVFNSYQSSTPTTNGSVTISVSETKPTFTYAISSSGDHVFAAVITDTQYPLTIDAQSTAEALVLLSPLLITQNKEEYSKIIALTKSDNTVKALASVIEAVYSSAVDEPLSDKRILDAANDAVTSVLISLKATDLSVSPPKAFVSNSTNNFLSSSASSIQAHEYDMGALTLVNSSGATLRVDVANAGPLGIKTNVDWVAEIVELDPSRIQWYQDGSFPFSPYDIDNLIKTNGYRQKIIIEGELASGWLEWTSDFFGTVAEKISGELFSEEGITLDHDGVYAVIALSGSPFGDSNEYGSIKNSEWQTALWNDALAINMVTIWLNVMEVGLNISPVPNDLSRFLDEQFLMVKLAITDNPKNVGVDFVVEQAADVADNLLDFLKPFLHLAVSDLQSAGVKKFLHVAIDSAVKSRYDTFSGTISFGTRIGNYLLDVTPRESGYVVLGTPWVSRDIPPSIPTDLTSKAASSSQINLSWNANADGDLAGYKIYRGGSYLKSVIGTSTTDTDLSQSTQYCYTILAYDTSGNVSAQSSQACATTTVANISPTTALQVDGFTNNYSTMTTPYQPTISLTGSGFNSVTQISWSCAMPSGASCTGSPFVWTSSNWGGKFTRTIDTAASVSPVLLTAGDPTGTYAWTVTFSGTNSSVVKTFTVINASPETTMTPTPTITSVTPSTLTQGSSYQNVTITGTNFTSSSYHQYSIDGGSTWSWAISAPTINSSTSMTIGVDDTVVQTSSFRVCASNGSSACSGSVAVTIQAATSTSSTSPTANTGTAQPSGATTALLFGAINPNGGATDAWFDWGTTTSYGNTTPRVSIGAGTSAVQQTPQISNLAPGQTYHFRIVGQNSRGTSYGNDMSFTMPAVATLKPTVTTGNASDKTTTSATLEGVFNPNGAPASVWFEWGTTTSYGNTTSVMSYGGTGTADIPASQIITNLSAGVTYHFRIAAENAVGRSQGSDQTFTTMAAASGSPDLVVQYISFSPSSVDVGGTVAARWTLTNAGNAAAAESSTVVRINQSTSSAAGANLATVNTPALAAGASIVQNASVTAPTTLGTYRVWVIADNYSTSGQTAATTDDNDLMLATGTLTVASGSLSAATLSSPLNGATGISTTPTLSWSAVAGANRYWLMVATSSTAFPTALDATSCPICVSTGISGNTNLTSHTLPNNFPINGTSRTLSAGTTYFWKVQAWNTNGTQGQYSATGSFTTR